MDAYRQIAFTARTSPIFYQQIFEKKSVRYKDHWFVELQNRIALMTDEDLLRKSLEIGYDDIKQPEIIDALCNGALIMARMFDIGPCQEPYVLYDGNKSLYLFAYYSGPKLDINWMLFEEKAYIASGGLYYTYADEPEEERLIKAASYLKTILGFN